MKIQRWMLLGMFCLSVSFVGCDSRIEPAARPVLTVYCGATMIGAVSEIASLVEHEKNCEIQITKGGSGNLLRAIEVNREGDLYLPGADSYIQQAREQGFVDQVVAVGENRAVILVPEGNPKNISNDPVVFTDPQYRSIFADPSSGSIGRMAGEIFTKRGVMDAALDQVSRISTDSKDITTAVKSGEVDMGVNWYAVTCWAENRDELDAVLMSEEFAPPKKLVLGRLTLSKYPEIADFFMQIAGGSRGKEIFEKYGFGELKEVAP